MTEPVDLATATDRWAGVLPFAELSVAANGTAQAVVPADRLREALGLLAEHDAALGLVDLTATGTANRPPVSAVYQLRAADGDRLQLSAPDAEQLPSLTDLWPAADWPERELTEIAGVYFPDRPPAPPLFAAQVPDPEDETEIDEQFEALPDPSCVCAWRLDLRAHCRGGVIERASAHPGRLRSGFEALAARRGYAQLPVLAESLNEQAPYAVGLAAVLAAEALLGLAPPSRCTWVRTLLAEISRLAAHCTWLANQVGDDAALWGEALRVRDVAAEFLLVASGRRWATGIQRLGGISADLPEAAAGRLSALAADVDRLRRDAERHTVDNRSWRRRYTGIGILDAERAHSMAASGPVARAAGIDVDVRRSDAYLAYGELQFTVPRGSLGDVVDRVQVRLDEMAQSVSMARQCVHIPQGPLRVDAAPTPTSTATGPAELIRHFELWMDGHGHRPAPGAQVYLPTESADGELAFYLLSDGNGKPRRVHLRSPSLYHFQLAPALLPGVRRSRAAGVVASLNVVAPEMDR